MCAAFGTSIKMLVLCSLANDTAVEAAMCRAEHFHTLQQCSLHLLTGRADA